MLNCVIMVNIDHILNEVCLDERIPDGIFKMDENEHIEVLRDKLVECGNLSFNESIGITNKMLEGKYPERQAYNKDGILVTFPTPQHMQRAMNRGTHFKEDPSKPPENVFSDPNATSQVLPNQSPPPPEGSDSGRDHSGKDDSIDFTKSALKVEPNPTDKESPASFEKFKSGKERAAEADVAKQILQGDETALSLDLNEMVEREYKELIAVYDYAKQHKYCRAMDVLLEAMNSL